MKTKLMILLVLVGISLTGCYKTKTLETKHPTGELKSRCTAVQFHGEVPSKLGLETVWSKKGKKIATITWEYGEREGTAIYWNEKGEVITRGQYREGKKHGTWKDYTGGKVTTETRYHFGKKQGTEITTLPDQTVNTKTWARGVLHGKVESLSPSGQILYRHIWEDGILKSSTTWNKDGTVKETTLEHPQN